MADASEEQIRRGVERLAGLLANEDGRRSFVDDPHGTMKGAEIDPAHVPSGLVDTLQTLTPEEWQVLDKVSAPLSEAGVSQHGLTFF